MEFPLFVPKYDNRIGKYTWYEDKIPENSTT